ncbi:MAG: small basic protein [Phycisphaerae bacterium]|nr:small basic protein [Phycisphaerae bacterium]
MSLDRSLKVSANLAGKRSVMTRAERVAKMKTDKKIDESKNGALGLPKTLVSNK